MSRTPAAERIERAFAECSPASPVGAYLLERYRRGITTDGSDSAQDSETMLFHAACRLVEDVPFETLSIQQLLDAGSDAALSPGAQKRRLRVIRRLVRLLQHDGDLPGSKELRAWRLVNREIAQTPPGGAQTRLRQWLGRRSHQVGPNELMWEAKALARLERLLAEQPNMHAGDAVTQWLHQIVRQVVACDCPPVTRHLYPDRCACCGATVSKRGTKPSPAPSKQAELRSIGLRYLEFARLRMVAGSSS